MPDWVREDYKQLTDFCKQYGAGKIDADMWFSIADPIYPKPPCESCLAISLPPAKPIPKNFKIYALFLFPSATWSNSPYFDHEMLKQFRQFGDAIGNENAAIWLESWSNGSIDFARSKDYADKFGVNYNDGPYVIVTRHRPDQYKNGDQRLMIKLNGISSERIVFALNLLTQQIRMNEDVSRSRVLEFEEIKQRVLTFISDHQDLVSEVVTKSLFR